MGKSSQKVSKGEIEINPSIIRFTHSRIRPYFTGCGRKVEDTLHDLISHRISVHDLPLITVIVVKDSQGSTNYFSLNNRRLYVLKKLQEMGLLERGMTRVQIKTPLDREKERYTTERCSLEAIIMKDYSGKSKSKEDRIIKENTEEEWEG